MKISEILEPATIRIPIQNQNKEEIIAEMVSLLKESGRIESEHEILSAVIERERCMTTGIGKGLAIPHGKCGAVESVVGALALAPEGVNFEAMDKKPVEVVVLMVSNPTASRLHLHIISLISRIFKDPEFKTRLLECEDSQAVYQAIVDYETQAK